MTTIQQYRPQTAASDAESIVRTAMAQAELTSTRKPHRGARIIAAAAVAALGIGALASGTAQAGPDWRNQATMAGVTFTVDYGTYCEGYQETGHRAFIRMLARSSDFRSPRKARVEARTIARVHRIECVRGGTVWEDGSYSLPSGKTGPLRHSDARRDR